MRHWTPPFQTKRRRRRPIETRKAQANPQKALEQIYSDLGKRIGLVEPTEEQLESVVGLNLDDVEKAYVRYVETDFGADDVYINPSKRWGR